MPENVHVHLHPHSMDRHPCLPMDGHPCLPMDGHPCLPMDGNIKYESKYSLQKGSLQ